jgi:imidazolonepropionase-like amidohydrolase
MLDGWAWEDMVLKAPIGLHLNWPWMTIRYGPNVKLSEEEQKKKRDEQIKELRDAFFQARSYMTAREARMASGASDLPVDLRWEAMIPVLKRKIPVFVYADEARQINAAIAWAEQENIRPIILGGQDSWRVADLLREKNIPVVLMPILRTPMRDWEGYDTPFSVAARLAKKGVHFCIAGDGGTSNELKYNNERNLPYHAAMAAAFGLAKEEALKAITLYPAQILGVADRIGSLEPGKDATFIVTDGDPLEIVTRVERVFIQGKDVDLRNKHLMLYEKYTEKYRRLSKP